MEQKKLKFPKALAATRPQVATPHIMQSTSDTKMMEGEKLLDLEAKTGTVTAMATLTPQADRAVLAFKAAVGISPNTLEKIVETGDLGEFTKIVQHMMAEMSASMVESNFRDKADLEKILESMPRAANVPLLSEVDVPSYVITSAALQKAFQEYIKDLKAVEAIRDKLEDVLEKEQQDDKLKKLSDMTGHSRAAVLLAMNFGVLMAAAESRNIDMFSVIHSLFGEGLMKLLSAHLGAMYDRQHKKYVDLSVRKQDLGETTEIKVERDDGATDDDSED